MARGRALVAALHLAAVGLLAPLLVLCEDGDRHRAIESALSLCCSQAGPESSDGIPPQSAAGPADDDCADSCTDTPLLASIDVFSPRNSGPASGAVALVPPVAQARCPAPEFQRKDAGFLSAVASSHLVRFTVLRI